MLWDKKTKILPLTQPQHCCMDSDMILTRGKTEFRDTNHDNDFTYPGQTDQARLTLIWRGKTSKVRKQGGKR